MLMLDPKTYYELHIKNKSIPEIKHEIRCLKRRIGKLKSDIERQNLPTNNPEITIPGPKDSLPWCIEYLSYIREKLKKDGIEIPMSQNEKRAEDFQEKIEHIKTITYRIKKKDPEYLEVEYFVDLTSLPLKLSVKERGKKEEIRDVMPFFCDTDEEEKEDFLKALKDLYIGEWKPKAKSPYLDDYCNGDEWEVIFTYDDNNRKKRFKGKDYTPYNMEKFEYLLGVRQEEISLHNQLQKALKNARIKD